MRRASSAVRMERYRMVIKRAGVAQVQLQGPEVAGLPQELEAPE